MLDFSKWMISIKRPAGFKNSLDCPLCLGPLLVQFGLTVRELLAAFGEVITMDQGFQL